MGKTDDMQKTENHRIKGSPSRDRASTKRSDARVEKKRSFFCRVQDCFHLVAKRTSQVLGSAWSFAIAVLIIGVWASSGSVFHYSDTWQLVINTGTTIVTFLMVFLIQNTQNRDSKAVELKLNELIRAIEEARNEMVGLEDMPEEKLDEVQRDFKRLSEST